jgi:prepilin peptidase CpaA
VHPFVTDPLSIFLCIILVLAAVNDLQFRKIPNLLTFPVMGLAILYHAWFHGFDGLYFSIGGMLLGIALLIGPYLLGGMGAGDAKLMGAAGAVLGPKGVFISFLYTAIVGGMYAVLMLVIYRSHGRAIVGHLLSGVRSLLYTRQWAPTPIEPAEKSPRICYGLAIALGTVIYMALGRMGYDLFSGFRVL